MSPEPLDPEVGAGRRRDRSQRQVQVPRATVEEGVTKAACGPQEGFCRVQPPRDYSPGPEVSPEQGA